MKTLLDKLKITMMEGDTAILAVGPIESAVKNVFSPVVMFNDQQLGLPELFSQAITPEEYATRESLSIQVSQPRVPKKWVFMEKALPVR